MTPEDAERCEESGDLVQAISMWEVLAKREHSALFFCRAGSLADDFGWWERADYLFQQALEIDEHFALALECLGQLYIERDDKPRNECLQQAKTFLLKALKEDRNERVLTCLGAVYRFLEETDQAIHVLGDALRINGNYEEAMFNLAECKEPAASIELLTRAIEIDPAYAAAHRELGVHLVRKRDLQDAEYHLRRALEINPADYWAHMHLANMLGIQGRNVEAEQTYKLATTLHPELRDGIEIFARFLDSIGKNDQAAVVRRDAHLQ